MNSFAGFQSFFNSEQDRTIELLSAVYADRPRLKQVISDFFAAQGLSNRIKGKKILLKPNWVGHNRKSNDDICLRTHDNFLLAGLEVVLEQNPHSVMIGDAPLQGSDWEKITHPIMPAVKTLSEQYGIPVILKDFRRAIYTERTGTIPNPRSNPKDYLIFDLGKNSLLEEICDDKRKPFRVTCYNPDRLALSHSSGKHQYCIAGDFFSNDIVITMPKIKTHEKSGLTNAMKILVGINGDKDFLPHHRVGGTSDGGDCYPGRNLWLRLAEWSLDMYNRRFHPFSDKLFQRLTSRLIRWGKEDALHNLRAGWYGNDTVWRMVFDLNRIALYGKEDGTISKIPQRDIYSLADGIIAGEGNGPMTPDPFPLGVIGFSNNAMLMDVAAGILMGMDISRIALLREAGKCYEGKETELFWNNEKILLEDLALHSLPAKMPSGWQEYQTNRNA